MSVSHLTWPCFILNILKHKYLLLCETAYTFLCGFVTLLCFLCCSCEQLTADPVCLCSGCLLYKPPGPCAADRTSWPALARTHLAAPACLCQGATTRSSAWWLSMKRELCIASLPSRYSLHQCDVTSPLKLATHGGLWWHSYKAQKRQFRNMIKDNHIPIESSSHQAHPLDCLIPVCKGFPFSTEWGVIVLWEELFHSHRGCVHGKSLGISVGHDPEV